MNKNLTYAIGLMSGTSLDGLDIVYVNFECDDSYDFKILASKTVKYCQDWKLKLQNAIKLQLKDLMELDVEYGNFLGQKVKDFVLDNNIKKLDFISSHGHTVFHQPEKGLTLQIGNGQVIANVTNSMIVCDFRTQDVKFGGQGAPLVPIGDRLLFPEFEACINLGGFANISFEKNYQLIAYDICPVNVILNHFSYLLGFEYDNRGDLAKEGKINVKLLNQLDHLDFYGQFPPKSLGIEWVNDKIIPILKEERNVNNILRTFTEHIAIQIVKNIKAFSSILFTGGGVYNEFLINRIRDLCKTEIQIPNEEIINFKEALIFAFLGLLKIEGKVNCLSSVTGASQDHSSGRIFHPKLN